MNGNRIVVFGLAAVLSVAVAGCGTKAGTSTGDGNTAPSPSVSPTPSAKNALLASTKAFDTSGYSVTVTKADGTIKAKSDATNKAAELLFDLKASGVSVKQDWILTEADTWIKMDLGTAALNRQFGVQPTKYMHVDRTKIKSTVPVTFGAGDALGVSGFKDALVSVTRSDNTHFAGTVDGSKLVDVEELDSAAVTKAADKAKSLPFTATVDDQGRLTEFKIDATAAGPDIAIDVKVTDIGGAASAVTKPAKSGVIEAPKTVYDMLNG